MLARVDTDGYKRKQNPNLNNKFPKFSFVTSGFFREQITQLVVKLQLDCLA